MTVLIVLAALLLVASVWLLTRPLVRSAQAVNNEEYHQLVLVRERLLAQLNELDVETGAMAATVVGDERTRLETELAQVLRRLETLVPDAAGATETVAPRARRSILILVALLVPLVAIGLYAGKQAKTLEQITLLGAGGQPDPLKMVARLEQRLAQAPDDAAGWARLGRSYMVLERYEDAKRAMGRAAELAPQDQAILTEYATLLIVENPREPSAEALAAFARLYALNPKHPGALWVLGLDAFNRAKYREAIKHWEGLLKELPPDAEVAPQVRQALAQARKNIGKHR